jgi:hypothetical protein
MDINVFRISLNISSNLSLKTQYTMNKPGQPMPRFLWLIIVTVLLISFQLKFKTNFSKSRMDGPS